MSITRPRGDGPPAPRTFRQIIIQFAVSGLVALLIIGVVAFLLLRRASTEESIRDATDLTEYIAASVVQPALDERPAVLTGDPDALAWFDRRIRERVLAHDTGIVRVKIWTRDGTVVYSDNPALIGRTYDLPDEFAASQEGGEAIAHTTSLTREENALDRLEGKLLEVYVPISDGRGNPLLVETYRRYSAIDAAGSSVLGKFLPIYLAGLLILGLVFTPLGLSMARQLQHAQRERERLLVSAIDASDRERRRIASELHDGPVQELAGVSFALAGAADRAGPETPDSVRRSLGDAATATREIMRHLRGVLVAIHPPSLQAAGLEAALSDLLARLRADGIATSLDASGLPALPPDIEALLFRGAQEALRNVAAHSGARNVRLTIAADERSVTLAVTDDGRGFDPATRERRRGDGHIGLDLLAELVHDAGGRLDVDSRPGSGTTVAIVVPRP